MNSSPERFDRIKDTLRERFAVSDVGWIPLRGPSTFSRYEEWLDRGHAGDMGYLREHAPLKKDPVALLHGARSVLLLTCSYLPHPAPRPEVFRGARVAAYARGEDYHFWLKRLIGDVSSFLADEFPGARFLGGTDVLPILERDFAVQAGLGWIGKNTCLIHPAKGSFHFIAEILTDIEVPRGVTTVVGPGGVADSASSASELVPLPDLCGTCTRCIEVCPTGALETPRVLNATKCISYWTIEAKTVPPVALRGKIHDLFFGCDLCQSVCPWNKKVFRTFEDPPAVRALSSEMREALIESLRFILKSSNRALAARVHGTPLDRARPFGLRRNAMIVAANSGLAELRDDIARFRDNERLGELARWSLEVLGGDSSPPMI